MEKGRVLGLSDASVIPGSASGNVTRSAKALLASVEPMVAHREQILRVVEVGAIPLLATRDRVRLSSGTWHPTRALRRVMSASGVSIPRVRAFDASACRAALAGYPAGLHLG
jgi:hypothetical protein